MSSPRGLDERGIVAMTVFVDWRRVNLGWIWEMGDAVDIEG